jgi:hypothetical protein
LRFATAFSELGGEPSEFLSRVLSADSLRMPPLATNRADLQGIGLLRAWISELGQP